MPSARESDRPRNHLSEPGPRGFALLSIGFLCVASVVVVILVLTSDAGAPSLWIGLGIISALFVQTSTLVAILFIWRGQREAQAFGDELLRRSRNQGSRLRQVAVRSRDQSRQIARLTEDHTRAVTATRNDRERTERVRATLDRRMVELHLDTQRQVQALMNLDRLVRIDGVVPPMGGWAASPDLILLCMGILLNEKPTTVVECGSGVSTLFLALTVTQHDLSTKIVSLEHDERYARSTRQLLSHHGVHEQAEVVHAPLERTSLRDHETPWYAESAIAGLEKVGLVIVDGPPDVTGPGARYPALPLMRARLAPRCTLVMDDLNRPSDRDVAERWAREQPDFELEVITDFQKEVGILRRG